MDDFAKRTCIGEEGCIPVRYLWTDAFAVCNFLELFRKSGEADYREKALQLVDQVHHILGKHRSDDIRSGWISGLDEKEGELHPTIGGLRIGKKDNERKRDEPYDERKEWDQDGQYYHYLTKWIYALGFVYDVTGDTKYIRWALELAKSAYEKFTYTTPIGSKRMYWKMSIDLTYPLVPSMGQHDALDGFIIYTQLKQKLLQRKSISESIDLDPAIESLYHISRSISWESDDPLGIGGLLSDACILTKLIAQKGRIDLSDMLNLLLEQGLRGLEKFMHTGSLKYPAHYRLPFREFGLSIGLHGVPKMKLMVERHAGRFTEPLHTVKMLDAMRAYLPLCGYIEKFWLNRENQKSPTWRDHLDINAVMLASSLDPDAVLGI